MPIGTPERGERSGALDSLRGLAIALVVAQHWFGFAVGWTGVDLFFVLSGYLIGGILIDNRESATYFRTFYARRAFRILPLYWLLLAIALPIWGSRTPLWSYLTFTQNFYDAHIGPTREITELTWSLAVEEQFYLLLPLLIRVAPPELLLRISVYFVLTAFVCRVPVANSFGSTWAAYVLLPCRMDALFVGVAVACIVRHQNMLAAIRRRQWAVWAVSGISAALFVVVGASGRSGFAMGAPQMVTVGYSLGATTYGTLLLILVVIRWQPPRWLPLRALGIGAYSIYLFHLLITNTIVEATGLSWQIAAWPAGILSAALSAGSWTLLERPIIHWAKARWNYEVDRDPSIDAFALGR